MKVALVHDYLKEPGGAESVLMTLKEIWPDAPVYTAYKFPMFWGRFKPVLASWDIRESWGRYLPFLPKLISHYTIFSPLFFRAMDLSDYDLVVISATGGYFPNGVSAGKKTTVVTYCHTPPRFLYGYDTATRQRYKWYWRPISAVANHILLMVDFRFAQRPDMIIANSKNVANRVRKFYRREAEVVYPPIEPAMPVKGKRKNYYLIVSRIVGSKNIELAVDAANTYGFELKVAGKPIGTSGQEILVKMTGKNVEYLGEVSEGEKARLLAEAKGFLALERDADFGMTTVEPQVYGTPVIAYRNGGYLETVLDGKTGVFFDELSARGLAEAVKRFEKITFSAEAIKKNAERFSKDRFKKQMQDLVVKARRGKR